jgi:hypothetical protein
VKVFYSALLLLLVGSLMCLEFIISRLPYQPMTRIRVRDAAGPAPSVSDP